MARPTPSSPTISRENPDDAEAAALVQTAFRGETLRGLLLNAYAFWKMAQIAMYAAIAAFVGAGLMLLLSIAGFVHLRRVDPTEEAFTAHTEQGARAGLTALPAPGGHRVTEAPAEHRQGPRCAQRCSRKTRSTSRCAAWPSSQGVKSARKAA